MTKDLTTGKIMPILVKFTVPLVLGNLFQLTYNAVDSIIVGHFVGKEALAAVGICNPVSTLMILFLNGLCMGASILMGIQILETGKLDTRPEKRVKLFHILKDESEHLLALTEKVLTLSKLENHKLEIDKRNILLEPVIEDLKEKFIAKSAKPIHFTIDLEVKKVYTDEEFFKELMSNLIDNAMKYSKESIEIKISSHYDDRYTIIKIYDNGIGISKKDQRTIFDKFERASATKRTKYGGPAGFGLGLNYVYQVIEAHEGKVYVNSIEGDFTEFTLFIPKIMEEL